MTTDNQEYPCDFCKRDIGLKIFVNRYIFSKNLRKADDLENKANQISLYDLSYQKSIVKNYLNPPQATIPFRLNEDKPDGVTSLSTIKVTAEKPAKYFYSKNKNIHSVDTYGYNGSTLRQGYLYVYMKHINQWQEYMISEKGFLKRINSLNYFEVEGDPQANSLNNKKEPCLEISHRANGLTIIIPKPLEASQVYFKYSENSWSKNTKKRNNLFGFYEKYMDCFDVKKFISGQYQKGAFPMVNGIEDFNIDGDYKNVSGVNKNSYAVYNLSKIESQVKDALSYLCGKTYEDIFTKISKNSGKGEDKLLSTLNIGNSKSFLSGLQREDLEQALTDEKKLRILFGAIFTINDPIAEVMDVSSFISHQIVDDSDYTELEQTVNIIENLKTQYMGINAEPIYTLNERLEKDRARTMIEMAAAADGAIFSPYLFEDMKNEKLTSEQRRAKEIQDKKNEQDAKVKKWDKEYVHKIDQEKYGKNLETLTNKKKSQIQIADNLDSLLHSIITSSYITDHLFYNTEKGNINDLSIKLINLNYILESLKGCPKSKAFYSQFIYETKDPNNYFLNTMSLDSDQVRAKMNDAIDKFQIKDHTNIATMPFSDLLNSFLAYADEKLKNLRLPFASMHELNGLIFTQITNCMSHILAFKPPARFPNHPLVPVLVTIATRSHVGFNEIRFKEGNLGDFNGQLRKYLRSVYNLMGVKNINDNVLGKMIADDPYWQKKFELCKASGKFLVADVKFNQEYLDSLPKNYKAAYLYHQDVMKGSVKKLEILNTDVSDDLLSSPAQSKFYITKVAVAGLQVWSCYAVLTDTKLSGAEKTLRSGSAIAGVTTAALELIAMMGNIFQNASSKSNLLRKINAFVLEATGDLTKSVPKVITENGITNTRNVIKIVPKALVWRSVGLIGSTIGSFYDIKNGIEAYNHGEENYGKWLIRSGVSVLVGSAIIFAAASNPLGWILILVGIVFAIVAYILRDNEIILWIRRSLLTTDKKIKVFVSFEEQAKGLELIFK
ncbi:hypothetical protein KTH93_20540 [Acinetobacter bereziniae]|uniref:T6SS effector BTH_I2691 family protein n=1 Tax=Acinetobacter bereziniae TaxID=106648 RepID=UPI0021D00B81|nr:T6SS effector BTH_I2691 family protein [Acinetobacter bereziniae]MCU4437845.1 hypothetical protein [Acinetobacter bereziniae]